MVIFQAIDWRDYDKYEGDYTIRVYGRSINNDNVTLEINGFSPFFYVSVPKKFKTANVLIKTLQKKLADYSPSFTVVKRHKFKSFNNNKISEFIRLSFSQKKLFTRARTALENWSVSVDLYESNIEPITRFIHTTNVKPCGWINANDTCVLGVDDISPCQMPNEAKFVMLFFDIECTSGDGSFPQPDRIEDEIIQIGSVFRRHTETQPYLRVIHVLGTCDSIEGVEVHTFEDEEELLISWASLVTKENPDILSGYNIFGFDFMYIYERSKFLGCSERLSKKLSSSKMGVRFVERKLTSSALGDNMLKYYDINGCVNIDIMKVIQKDYKLESYSLDFVSAHFFSTVVTKINGKQLFTDPGTLTKGDLVVIVNSDGVSTRHIGKFKIASVKKDSIVLEKEISDTSTGTIYWSYTKGDVAPQEIFRLHRQGGSIGRSTIARYCIQDCELCSKLLLKLNILSNSIALGNVCLVPLSFLFLRGQSVKTFSLIAKRCSEKNYLIPTTTRSNSGAYEGAIVLPPEVGVYYNPIAVLDYEALYANSIIYRNISHDCFVTKDKYMHLPNYYYYTVSYIEDGKITKAVFARKKCSNSNGIIPEILQGVIDERRHVKGLMKTEKDSFKYMILDGVQLALKTVGNSIYGVLGATISKVYNKSLAASTTATGRDMLLFAKGFVEDILPIISKSLVDNDTKKFIKQIDDIKNGKIKKYASKSFNELLTRCTDLIPNKNINIDIDTSHVTTIVSPKVIYGDTDSIFIDYQTNKKADVSMVIQLAIFTTNLLNVFLPFPQKIEYEKTYHPFIIISKKKYIGNLYEFNPNEYKQKGMGVILRRRDNAPIVRVVYGKIIKAILQETNPEAAISIAREIVYDVLCGKYPLEKFIITKTLRSEYKSRQRIAHVALADKMAERDPGNKPIPNTRIPYVYIRVNKEVKLQGDMVEHPDEVIKRQLKIDYLFYVTNQIEKPCSQVLSLLGDSHDIFNELKIVEKNRRLGKIPINLHSNNRDGIGLDE